jgi:hypothetical protein
MGEDEADGAVVDASVVYATLLRIQRMEAKFPETEEEYHMLMRGMWLDLRLAPAMQQAMTQLSPAQLAAYRVIDSLFYFKGDWQAALNTMREEMLQKNAPYAAIHTLALKACVAWEAKDPREKGGVAP